VENQDDRGAVSGYNAHNYGMVIGADGELGSADRLGAAFAMANTNISGNSSNAPQSSSVSTYQFVLYGSHSLNADTDINYHAAIGSKTNKGTRNIPFMGTTAQSNYNSLSAHIGAGVAHTIPLNERTSFTPSVRADYSTIRSDAYTETGANALNLIVDSNTVSELILSADGKFTHSLEDNTQLIANIGVGYNTMAKQASITSAFAGDSTASFVTNGLNPSAWMGHAGVGVVRKLESGAELTARYDLNANDTGYTGQSVSVKARWAF